MSSTLTQSGLTDHRVWWRGPLLRVGGATVFAVALVVARPMITPVVSHESSTVVAERDLRFVDRPDGQVGVINVADGSIVELIGVGQDSFVRATMRGLAQARLNSGVSPSLPFHLTAWADGRLSLTDPGTGRNIELESFGQTNEADFARMLPIRVSRTDGAVQ